MSLIFSKSCEYATQAVLYLARKTDSQPVLVREMSEVLQIPHHFLNKILQALAKDGIVESQRGFNGGFVLGKPATRITLDDIVRSIDGGDFLNACVLGFPHCGDENPCPVHDDWKQIKKMLNSMLKKKDIAELGTKLDSKLHLLEKKLAQYKTEGFH
jgi:Rrf2 family protein